MISIGFGLLGLSGVGAHPCRRRGKWCRSGEGGLSHVQKKRERIQPYYHYFYIAMLLTIHYCRLLHIPVRFEWKTLCVLKIYYSPPGFLAWLGSRNSQFSNSWIVNYSVDFPEPRPNTNQQTWEQVGASYVCASSCSRNSWNDYHAIGVVCWVNWCIRVVIWVISWGDR